MPALESKTVMIEFKRRIDALTYRFHPCELIQDNPAWKREDLDLWVTKIAHFGWVCIDSKRVMCAIPWGIAFDDMGELPPEGEWISKKADKSYVYDVRLLQAHTGLHCMNATNFDKKFDSGEDITTLLDLAKVRRPGRAGV